MQKTLQQETVDKFVNATKRHGLLDFLKQTLPTNSFNTGYFKKAHAYYSKKIKKPFALFEQPQYQRELKFTSNFQSYLESKQYFDNIRQQSPENVESVQNKVIKQTYDGMMTIDPVTNIKKFTIKNNRLDSQNSYFPTHQTISLPTRKDRDKDNKVPKLKLKLDRKKSLSFYMQENYKLSACLKKEQKDASPKKQKDLSPRFKINQADFLTRLNEINSTKAKKGNFRIQKIKMHKILQQRYGYQIFTSFFMMQTKENLQGMLKIIKELTNLPLHHLHLFAFLSFDVNYDGLICEDDLLSITKTITPDSIVGQDINKIVRYAKLNVILDNSIDLPSQVLNYPTLRTLRKMRQQNNSSLPIVSNLPIVKRFFTTNFIQNEQRQKLQPIRKINHKNNINKNIVINFKTFQKIFDQNVPNFIADIICFLSETKFKNINYSQNTTKLSPNQEQKPLFIPQTAEERAKRQTHFASKYLDQHYKISKTLSKFKL